MSRNFCFACLFATGLVLQHVAGLVVRVAPDGVDAMCNSTLFCHSIQGALQWFRLPNVTLVVDWPTLSIDHTVLSGAVQPGLEITSSTNSTTVICAASPCFVFEASARLSHLRFVSLEVVSDALIVTNASLALFDCVFTDFELSQPLVAVVRDPDSVDIFFSCSLCVFLRNSAPSGSDPQLPMVYLLSVLSAAFDRCLFSHNAQLLAVYGDYLADQFIASSVRISHSIFEHNIFIPPSDRWYWSGLMYLQEVPFVEISHTRISNNTFSTLTGVAAILRHSSPPRSSFIVADSSISTNAISAPAAVAYAAAFLFGEYYDTFASVRSVFQRNFGASPLFYLANATGLPFGFVQSCVFNGNAASAAQSNSAVTIQDGPGLIINSEFVANSSPAASSVNVSNDIVHITDCLFHANVGKARGAIVCSKVSSFDHVVYDLFLSGRC